MIFARMRGGSDPSSPASTDSRAAYDVAQPRPVRRYPPMPVLEEYLSGSSNSGSCASSPILFRPQHFSPGLAGRCSTPSPTTAVAGGHNPFLLGVPKDELQWAASPPMSPVPADWNATQLESMRLDDAAPAYCLQELNGQERTRRWSITHKAHKTVDKANGPAIDIQLDEYATPTPSQNGDQ